jgi:N-acyl-D-aspartate/D-glutamate deacylase
LQISIIPKRHAELKKYTIGPSKASTADCPQEKMSAEQEKAVEEGTFGRTKEKTIEENTSDQGGGQN